MRDHIIVTAGNVVSRLFGLMATILFARTLGKEQFGIYTIAFTGFMLLTQMGVAVEVLFLRKYKTEGTHGISYREHLIQKLLIGASVVTIAVLIGGLWWLVQEPSLTTMLCGTVVTCAVLAHFVYGTRLTIHQAAGQFKKYAKMQLAWNVIYFANAAAFIALGVRHIPILLLALLIPSLPWGVEAICKVRREHALGIKDLLRRRDGYALAYGVITANLIYAIYQRLDVLAIGALGRLTAVGLYGVSVRFHTLAMMACSSLNVVTQAKGTNPATWQKIETRREYLRKAWLYTIAVSGLSLIAYLLCDEIILVLFGEEYVEAASAAKVLLLAPPFIAWYMPYYYFYYAMALHHRLVVVGAVQLGVIALSLGMLVPFYGPVGAASSTVIGYAVGGIMVVVDVLRLQSRVHRLA